MKKINLFMLCLMFGMFLISFASAEIQTLGTFKVDEEINLIQTCANCTFNNITSVIGPDSQQIIGNLPMTKTGSVYNFTLTSGNITQLGEYIINGIGDLDGVNTVWNYNLEVTTTGKQSNLPIPIFLLIASVTLFITGILLKSPPFGFFAGVLFILIGMYMMIYGFGNVADLYTQAFALVTLGFGFIIAILAGFSWLDEYDEDK